MKRSRLDWRTVVLDAWPLLLAVILVAPLLTRQGWPLARDLMFVPRQVWTDASLGLGGAAPRAVPLDAVLAPLTWVLDGGVLARIVLPLVLAGAGWGCHRLVRSCGTAARLAVGGFAVWNPYVVERLALGQWALLAAYAALPWLAMAVHRYARSGTPRHLASVVLWTAVASLTPTGGLLAFFVIIVLGLRRSRRTLLLLGSALLLQLPWLVPAITGAAGYSSDPAGVEAFSARAEGPGGPVVALLGLGGIWDGRSVPATRETWLATVAAVLVVVVMLQGLRRIRSTWGAGTASRIALLGLIGLLLAAASSTDLGGDALRAMVGSVPGAGLLRDAQKFLALTVVAVAVCLGMAADGLVRAVTRAGAEARVALLIALVTGPLVLLPDAAGVVWRTVTPVAYPAGMSRVAELLAEDPRRGDLVTLPWRSYRRFDWGNGEVSADPATRWFDRDLLAPDDLQVGEVLVRGESETARRLGTELETSRPADVLGDYGVAWALVYKDDPAEPELDLTGLAEVYDDDDLALYEVPGPVPEALGPSVVRRALVGSADGLAVLLVLVASAIRVRRRQKHSTEPTEW